MNQLAAPTQLSAAISSVFTIWCEIRSWW